MTPKQSKPFLPGPACPDLLRDGDLGPWPGAPGTTMKIRKTTWDGTGPQD